MIATTEETMSLFACLGSQQYVFYTTAEKLALAKTVHIVCVTNPPLSIFVRDDPLQHAGAVWEGISCLRYHATSSCRFSARKTRSFLPLARFTQSGRMQHRHLMMRKCWQRSTVLRSDTARVPTISFSAARSYGKETYSIYYSLIVFQKLESNCCFMTSFDMLISCMKSIRDIMGLGHRAERIFHLLVNSVMNLPQRFSLLLAHHNVYHTSLIISKLSFYTLLYRRLLSFFIFSFSFFPPFLFCFHFIF